MKLIFSILAALILVSLYVQKVGADDVASSATVTNVIPVSSAVSIDAGAGSIALTENTTTNVIVTATVSDDNGCEDIVSVSVKFYRTDKTSACSADENDCYSQAATLDGGTCTPGGTDLSSTWTATIPVYYYADPTDAGSANEGTTWSSTVTPNDGSGGTAGTDDTIEMSSLTALNVTPTINYGGMSLGLNTGTTDQTTTVTNTGNRALGTQVDGYGSINGDGKSMICDEIGSIDIGKEKYHNVASTIYESKTALTDTASTVSGLSIPQRTTTATTSNIYWGFEMPTSGVSGACTGTVVFTAISV